MIKTTTKLSLGASTFLTLAWLAYIGIRAVNVGFTHDESSSFLNFINLPVRDVFFNERYWGTANNHPLNTLCMQMGYDFFGAEEWALRWGSVLGALLFLFYMIRLIRLWLLVSSWFFFGTCCIFLLNPFMVEFFSLARGYGLCLGFEMVGLFYFFRWIKIESRYDLLKSSCAISLGILSNFTLLDLMAAFFATAMVVIYIKSKRDFSIVNYVKSLALPAIPALVTLALIFQPMQWIKAKGEFDFGPVSFWETWRVLIQRFVYNPFPTSLWTIIPILVLGTLSVVLIGYTIYKRYKISGIEANPILFFATILTLTTMGITVLQYFLLDTNYLCGRTALLFYPLISSVIAFYFIDLIKNRKHSNRLWSLLIIILIINFCVQANIRNTHEWRYDQNTKEVAFLVNQQGNATKKIKYEVGWLFAPTTMFYQQTRALDQIEPIVHNESHDDVFRVKEKQYDFIYIQEELLPKVNDQYVLEKKFTEGILMRRR